MLDSKDRMQVALRFNTDSGDGWEWADAPYIGTIWHVPVGPPTR